MVHQSETEPFLKSVAREYLAQSQHGTLAMGLVFPNRRAAIFFRKYLSELLEGESLWMPGIFSAEELVRELCPVNLIDPMHLQFEFYTLYKALEGDAADTFDIFLTWAPQLLHDFEEADLYLVDTHKLYNSVDAAYAMKYWSPDGKPITATQEQYLRFWSKMGNWYTALRAHLREKKLWSSGMAYRYVAENTLALLEKLPYKRWIFAGFNALNAAEQQYMQFFERSGVAQIFWDTDALYLNDELHEAGYFFRKYRREWQLNLGEVPSLLDRPDQQIEMMGVSKNLGQAYYAASVLEDIAQKHPDFEDTALVLCDEKLLMPVLECLPDAVREANITMGYPIHQLPIAGFFQSVFELQRKMRVNRDGNIAFYFKDLLRFLRQPDTRKLLGEREAAALLKMVNEQRHIYMNLDTLCAKAPGMERLRPLLQSWNHSVSAAIAQLHAWIQILRDQAQADAQTETGYEFEALFQLSGLLNRIEGWHQTYPELFTVPVFQKMLQQLFRQSSLDFFGEPLEGLQIMGLLETRNLDFKRLILLSVNEGILPAARSHASFIPPDIAAAFGMPTYKERDAIYAYHFYRMLQRAERIHLVYTTETDEFGKGEPSRFIAQMEREFLKAQKKARTLIPELPSISEISIRVSKTPQLISQIQEKYRAKYLSPTALQTYVNCSLQFYLKYFSGVKVEEDREDDLDSSETGTILHTCLETLFKPFVGRSVHAEDVEAMMEIAPQLLREEFEKVLAQSDLEQGKNLLTYTGVETMLLNYLRAAQKEIQLDGAPSILKLEEEMEFELELDNLPGKPRIRLGGKADRIDQLGDTVRILDYKTGKMEASYVKLKSMDELRTDANKGKSLQLMLYRLFWEEAHPQDKTLPAIVSLKMPSEGLFTMDFPQDQEPDLQTLRNVFKDLSTEILDAEIPFEQADDPARCEYCNFKTLCNR
jgi:hypothetical protein